MLQVKHFDSSLSVIRPVIRIEVGADESKNHTMQEARRCEIMVQYLTNGDGQCVSGTWIRIFFPVL